MKALFVTSSAQAEANYYLIWHLLKVNRSDITHIVIISTEFTRKQGFVQNLKNVIESEYFGLDSSIGIEELYLPDGIEETSLQQIKQHINDWLMNNKPRFCIFNVTGGTKLISIAQEHIASNNPSYECIYQNRQNQIVWYNRADGKQLYDLTLPESIEARLRARGYQKVASEESFLNLPAEYMEYAVSVYKFMKQDLNLARGMVSLLNYCASDGLNGNASFPYSKSISHNALLDNCEDWLIELSNQTSFFDYDADAKSISFATADDVEFVGGKWFEILVGVILAGVLMPEQVERLGNIEIGLQFKNRSDGNEVDVTYLDDKGYMNFFECKTVKWDKSGGTTKVNRDLHHLSSVSKVAGLNSHIYFVSLYGLSQQSMKVASDLGIRVIAGKQLLSFSEYLIG